MVTVAPAIVLAFVLLWTGNLPLRTQWTLTVVISLVFLGGVLCFARLARSQELVATRAAGEFTINVIPGMEEYSSPVTVTTPANPAGPGVPAMPTIVSVRMRAKARGA